MKLRRAALGALVLVALAAPSWAAGEGRPRLLLLPVQDRVGDPAASQRVQVSLQNALESHFELADAEEARELMRAARLRDARAAPPSWLFELARRAGADSVICVSLLRARRGEIPALTLSAHALAPPEPRLAWAGFESASGVDDLRILGRGRVVELATLVPIVVDRLARDFVAGDAQARDVETHALESVFRRRDLRQDQVDVIAVMPFDAIVNESAGEASELATDLATARLHAAGVSLPWPGSVHEILLQRDRLDFGGLNPLDRTALRASVDAPAVFMGTVERFDVRRRDQLLEPATALSARLVDLDSGEILWMAGLELGGWDHPGLFGVSRVYDIGRLAESAMQSLVRDLRNAPTITTSRSSP